MCFVHHYQVFPDKKGEIASIYKGFEELYLSGDLLVRFMCYLYSKSVNT